MINKKTLFKSLIIISLLIIIIVAVIQIRKTLARYETTSTSEGNVDAAFWIVKNSFESDTDRILIDGIFPSDNSFDYIFTVSNFNGSNIAETDIEYEVTLTTTTNLPLSYEIQRNGTTYYTVNYQDSAGLYYVDNDEDEIDDGVYYREMKSSTAENPFPFYLDSIVKEIDDDGSETGKYVKTKVTDTFKIKVTFPKEFNINSEYADLMEDINIDLTARQVINE